MVHNKQSVYCGRFAPTPSGELHFGSLVTAVGSYLRAKSQNGFWLLRIEDVDLTRCKQVYADSILRTLEAFGLHWDKQEIYQSQRSSIYEEVIQDLMNGGHTYSCNCTRAIIKSNNGIHADTECRTRAKAITSNARTQETEIAQVAKIAKVENRAGVGASVRAETREGVVETLANVGKLNNSKTIIGNISNNISNSLNSLNSNSSIKLNVVDTIDTMIIDNKLNIHNITENLKNTSYPFNIRFKNDRRFEFFTDEIHGKIQVKPEFCNDFILKRKDGMYAYNLACVYDDIVTGVNEVVRGNDLIYDTFNQLSLIQALKSEAPDYMHLPLVLEANGLKFSKQNHAAPVGKNLKEIPSTLIKAIRFLGQNVPTKLYNANVDEILRFAINNFDVKKIPTEDSITRDNKHITQ